MNSFERILQQYPRPYLTNSELVIILNKTPDSRYSKVKRLLADGRLLHVRRGLYCLTEELGYLNKPHPFELAQYIYGPSYISLESALSYHNLIPERVYTTISVTGKRSKDFKTPLGVFSFLHFPMTNLYVEVELIKENEYTFFLAKPWKALCDYVFFYKKNCHNLDSVIKSLRIDLELLPLLRYEEYQLLMEYYHQNKMDRFLKDAFEATKSFHSE